MMYTRIGPPLSSQEISHLALFYGPIVLFRG